MRIWVICGAGRGVGKTHLALALTEILEHAVYAKRGHSAARPGKPPNYFRSDEELDAFVASCRGRFDNVVLESNAWARGRQAAMVIYIEGNDRLLDPRSDREQLRRLARIVIDPAERDGGEARAERVDWDAALRKLVPDPHRRALVVERLAAQRDHLRCAARGGPRVG